MRKLRAFLIVVGILTPWSLLLLGLLALISGCGSVGVDGEVVLRHEVSTKELEKLARRVCYQELPDGASPAEIDECVLLKMGDVFDLIESTKTVAGGAK